MALILISGLRGGVGVTSIAANLAMIVASGGHSAVLLDLSQASTLGLHFGLDPNQALPGFDAPGTATGPIHGVRLLNAAVQAASKDLGDGLSSGDFSFTGEVIHIADLSGADSGTVAQLRPYADLEICVLVPSAECLYDLPAALHSLPAETFFLLNRCDDSRRLGRHAASFVRELLGPRLIATVHADEAVAEAAAMMQPLARHSPASAALADIAVIGARITMLATSAPSVETTDVGKSKSNAA